MPLVPVIITLMKHLMTQLEGRPERVHHGRCAPIQKSHVREKRSSKHLNFHYCKALWYHGQIQCNAEPAGNEIFWCNFTMFGFGFTIPHKKYFTSFFSNAILTTNGEKNQREGSSFTEIQFLF